MSPTVVLYYGLFFLLTGSLNAFANGTFPLPAESSPSLLLGMGLISGVATLSPRMHLGQEEGDSGEDRGKGCRGGCDSFFLLGLAGVALGEGLAVRVMAGVTGKSKGVAVEAAAAEEEEAWEDMTFFVFVFVRCLVVVYVV